jgi:hypothetical protein
MDSLEHYKIILVLPSSATDLVVTYLPAVRGMRASTLSLHKIHKRQVQPDKCYRISTTYTQCNTSKGATASFHLPHRNTMRSILAAAVLAGGLLGSVSAHDHHEETVNKQEPFVGWTQEDLDAKWGTDVCLSTEINGFCD